MEYPISSLFSAVVWPVKNIYLDIENSFLRIDFFLKGVPKFLSTKWNTSLGCEAQASNSFEAPQRGPARNKRCSDLEKLSVSEINVVMGRVGVGCAMDEAEGEDKIFGVDDFLALFDEEEPSFEEIKETFEVFDSNKDGFIDCGELRRVLCDLGFKDGCDLEDCKRMIQDFDVNGDGLIDFREFVIFMEKCFSHS